MSLTGGTIKNVRLNHVPLFSEREIRQISGRSTHHHGSPSHTRPFLFPEFGTDGGMEKGEETLLPREMKKRQKEDEEEEEDTEIESPGHGEKERE